MGYVGRLVSDEIECYEVIASAVIQEVVIGGTGRTLVVDDGFI